MTSPPRLVAALAVVAVLLVGLAMRSHDPAPPLAKALHELQADSNFVRASDAGATLTRVSVELERAADGCEHECDEMLTAAAFTRVAAVTVLRCRHLEIFEFRSALRGYLASVEKGAAAEPPANPQC